MATEAVLLSGEKALEYVREIISEKKQVKSYWVELTLKDVYILEDAGSMDFSGKELRSGKLRRHPLKKESGEYGWWALRGGGFVVEYNEQVSLPEGSYALLSPKPELANNEATHPTMLLYPGEKLSRVTLSVGPPGINLKENARVSRLSIFKF